MLLFYYLCLYLENILPIASLPAGQGLLNIGAPRVKLFISFLNLPGFASAE